MDANLQFYILSIEVLSVLGVVGLTIFVAAIFLYAGYRFVVGDPWIIPDGEDVIPVLLLYFAFVIAWPILLFMGAVWVILLSLRKLVTN